MLFSCATAPKIPDKIINQFQHQQKLAQLLSWTIQGRIAIKTPKERFSATLHWQQRKQTYTIRLSSIIGTTLMELEGNANYAKLTYDGNQYIDTDPERLLYRTTGWQLPVKSLPSLIKGYVPHQTFQTEFSPDGFPQKVQEITNEYTSSWAVTYSGFEQIAAYWLPENITLKKNPNTIKIRINQWQLN